MQETETARWQIGGTAWTARWAGLWAVLWAVVPTILIFLILGPLIGYFAIMLPIALNAIDEPFGALQVLVASIALLPFGGLVAYGLGYMPALLTGVAAAVLDCVTDLGAYRTPVAIVAGSSITVFLVFTVLGTDSPPELGAFGFVTIGASVGAIAAGVCAMIAPRRFTSPPSA